MQAARGRRRARCGPPAPPFSDPGRYRLQIGPGRTAQLRSLPRERLIRLTLATALQNARHIGQQVTAPARELAQRRHRGGEFCLAQLAPPGMVLRLTVKLRDEDPVGLRALLDHTF